jgi:radical SAM protein with 4Fe4S-binding SPASM domain
MTPKEYFNHPTICPLPWSGFYLDPNGEIRNCSISEGILGNINNTPIEEILNSIKNHKIKEGMLSKIKVSECDSCWTFESTEANSSGIGGSNRTHFKTKLSAKIIKIIEEPTSFSLRQVDLRWRNTCNLACVYCGSNLSSTWAKELNENITVNEDALAKFKEYIFSNIEQLEYVYLCGGEPLLMKENIEFISLIKEKNPNIYIRVNTNLTNINSPIYKELLECTNVHWIISVESTAEYFEFIRYGAKWSAWINNLKQLAVDIKNTKHKITFNMVWFSLSAFSIFDAIDQFIELGFSTNSFFVQPLQDPDYLHINLLDYTTRTKLSAIIHNRLNTISTKDWLFASYQTMLGHLNILPSESDTTPLKNYLSELDIRRSTNGVDLFSHLL